MPGKPAAGVTDQSAGSQAVPLRPVAPRRLLPNADGKMSVRRRDCARC